MRHQATTAAIASNSAAPSPRGELDRIPHSADAQTLYRCVEKGKPTSYQNEPCAGAAKTASAVNYVPERKLPIRYPTAAPASQNHRRYPRAQVHSIPNAGSPNACNAAKQRREYVLGTNNQGGNVDVRRVLNDAVARACN